MLSECYSKLLPKLSDFLTLPVKFFVVLTSLEHLVRISPVHLTQEYVKNCKPFQESH